MEEIKITLRAARVNACLTREAAAKKLNICKQTLGNWENGKSSPSVVEAENIAKLYGLPRKNIIF